MDGVATGFIILMIALGGASAFVADILGYKIGKKRLSLWHIRPKYIARASVTITGMLIPLITVLILAASSAEFRTWVTRGRKAVEELKKKEDEVQAKNTLLRETDSSLKASQELLTKSKAQQSELAKTLDQKKKEAAAQELRAKQLSNTIGVQQSQLGRLSGAVSRAETTIRKFKYENASALKTLSVTKQLLAKEQSGLKEIRTSLDAATKQRDAAEGAKTQALTDYNNLNSRNLEIQKTNDELNKNLADLRKQLPSLIAEMEQLKTDKESYNRDLSDLIRQIDDRTRVLEQVRKENSTYAAFSRTSTLMFGKGEELARIIVPSSLTTDEARNLLRSLVRSARTKAAARGALPDPAYPFSGEAGLLRVVNRLELPQVEVEDFWIKQITPSNATRVLVARSTWNRFVGEPVTLDLSFYPNPIVFEQGDVIAEGRVDGRNSELSVYTEISDFVRIYVNAKAKRVKMIPIQGRDGETFGELAPGQLLTTITTIRSTNRLLRLQAVARKDTRAGDTLEFDLVVR